MAKTTKTEHSGGKNGGSSFYGKRAEAKTLCRKIRRSNDKKAIREGRREAGR